MRIMCLLLARQGNIQPPPNIGDDRPPEPFRTAISVDGAARWRRPARRSNHGHAGSGPRTVRARATPRRLLTPLSCLVTDLDGRFPGCGEAGTTELDAAGLAAAKAAGLGALADCCPLVLRQRDVTARGWPDGGGEVSGRASGMLLRCSRTSERDHLARVRLDLGAV